MKKLNNKRPLAAAGLAALCSVLFCMVTPRLAVMIAGGLLALAAFIFCLLRKYQTSTFLLLITFVFFFCSIAFFYNELCVVEPSKALLDQTVSIEGTVYDKPTKKENSTLIPLENCVINGYPTKLKIFLYCKSYDPASVGDVYYSGKADIFAFAEQNEFYYHTLSEGCWLRAYTLLAENTGQKDDGFRYKIKRFRESITQTLITHLGEEEGAVSAALLIGDKSELSADFILNLSTTGGSHLFAVSGMHLSIWTGAIFFILRKRSRIKIAPNLITILFVLCYMAVTGFSPSVTRAGIMLIITFTGKLFRRLGDGLNSLGIALLILLAGNVYLAGNISFLLSFSATWGIVLLSPYFSFSFIKKGRKPNAANRSAAWVVNTVLISLVALAFTLPISGFFFTGISLLSPVTTLLCTVPIQLTMISAFLSLCYSTIPFLGPLLFKVCSYGCKTIIFFIDKLSEWDFCTVPIRLPFLLVWYGVTVLIMLIIYYRFGKKSVRVLLALLLSASLLISTQIVSALTTRHVPFIYVHSVGNNTAVSLNITGTRFCAQIGTGADYNSLEGIKSFYAIKIGRASCRERV